MARGDVVDLATVHDALHHSLVKRGYPNLAHTIGVECRYVEGRGDPLVVYVISIAVAGCRRIEAPSFDAAIVDAMAAFDSVRLNRKGD